MKKILLMLLVLLTILIPVIGIGKPTKELYTVNVDHLSGNPLDFEQAIILNCTVQNTTHYLTGVSVTAFVYNSNNVLVTTSETIQSNNGIAYVSIQTTWQQVVGTYTINVIAFDEVGTGSNSTSVTMTYAANPTQTNNPINFQWANDIFYTFTAIGFIIITPIVVFKFVLRFRR